MTTDRPAGIGIALLGPPGSGKSTTAGLLKAAVERTGRTAAILKIAAPLYDVQHAFYARLGESLAEGEQDGALLNFLGSHFRQVSPPFLLADFERRCAEARPGVDVIICDDARQADLRGLQSNGFTVVRVRTPEPLRRQRKLGRADRVAGDDAHVTEAGADVASVDYEIDNSRTLSDLESNTSAVLAAILKTAQPS